MLCCDVALWFCVVMLCCNFVLWCCIVMMCEMLCVIVWVLVNVVVSCMMYDFKLFGVFGNRQTDKRTNGRTDIGGCRVPFATENVKGYVEKSPKTLLQWTGSLLCIEYHFSKSVIYLGSSAWYAIPRSKPCKRMKIVIQNHAKSMENIRSFEKKIWKYPCLCPDPHP